MSRLFSCDEVSEGTKQEEGMDKEAVRDDKMQEKVEIVV
jgi:hypothetical protein